MLKQRAGGGLSVDLCQAVCGARTGILISSVAVAWREDLIRLVSWRYRGQHTSRSGRAHMNSSSSPSGSSAYLESLMRAGQQSMKEFDDALVSAMGVEGKPATGGELSPFTFTANLQRQFWSPIVEFWKGTLGNASAAAFPAVEPGKALPGRGLAELALLPTHQEILLDDFKAVGRACRSSPGRRKIKAAASLLRASIHRCDEPVEFPCD